MSVPQIILLAVILVVIVILLVRATCIVSQATTYVIERLGKFHKTLDPGPHLIIPFVDRVAKKVSLKEQVADFAPQPVITKDNVTMRIDSVLFYKVVAAKDYVYGVNNPLVALENLVNTTLRNIIGGLELDETLASRENINAQMLEALEAATEPWGIQTTRVELKNITPPAAIQDSMEKQMKAERERREAILIAEGEKQSAILVAEGKKEAAIQEAEGEKQAAILRAEAEKQAALLRADAVREASIREAEGHGRAIELIQAANAEGIASMQEKLTNEEVLQLKSLEAFAKAADGKATKIIIPAELQSMAGMMTAAKEFLAPDPTADGKEVHN